MSLSSAPPPSESVWRIQTGSRLHCGLFVVDASAPRQFGGLGWMLAAPGFEITLRQSKHAEDCYQGPPEYRERVLTAAQRVRDGLGLQPAVTYEFRVTAVIPPHHGLGSGTQVALAVARLMTDASGHSEISAGYLARVVARGLRSGLGIHGFEQGGFLIEAGKRPGDLLSPLIFRCPFPSEWTTLLICPPAGAGLSGAAELQAFSQLPPMPQSLTAELCRLALLQLAPAVQGEDFAEFTAGLDEFGRLVGDYFAPVQGGRFADARLAQLATELQSQGWQGVAQSSWGPAIFVVCESMTAATELQRQLNESPWKDCRCLIAPPGNSGCQTELITTGT